MNLTDHNKKWTENNIGMNIGKYMKVDTEEFTFTLSLTTEQTCC